MFRRRWQPPFSSLWWASESNATPFTRVLSHVLLVTLVVGLAASPAGPAEAVEAVPTTQPRTACPLEVPDEKSAALSSRLCGGKVRIAELTNEYDEAWMSPSGAVEWNHRYRPVRVQRDNKWTPVDTTLRVDSDGTVRPKATVVDLKFSGGGSAPMVAVAEGDTTVELGSPVGTLPAPVLDGDTATYPEVLPGVDLQLRADVDGYAQVLVVKSRAAARNPKLAQLRFPVTSQGLDVKADAAGNFRATAKNGDLRFAGNAPVMWDAPAHPEPSGAARTGGRTRVMPSRLVGGALAVTPDKAMLEDAATVFPVYIDPGVSAARSAWTMVDSGNPTTSNWNSIYNARAGTNNGGTNKYRSFFNLNVGATPIAGKHIVSANFTITQTNGHSCTPRKIDLWATGGATSATTWNNQPAFAGILSSLTVSKGYNTSCPDGALTFSALQNVRAAADGAWKNVTLSLRSPNETDNTFYKTFSNNPTLAITYTSYATVGSRATSPSTACVTGSGRPYVNTATPVLKARIVDSDAATVQADFEWSAVGGSVIGSTITGSGAPGSELSTTVPAGAFAEGGTYAWRTRGFDGTVWGAWTAMCESTVDATAPSPAPTVTSTAYPKDQWRGGAGTAGTFTFGAGGLTDVAAYQYGLDADPTITVNPSALGGSAAVSLTPPTEGPHTLNVLSRDRAGNHSPIASYTFLVGSAAVTSPKDGDRTAREVPLAAMGPATATGVTFQYRRAEVDAWAEVPVTDVRRRSDGGTVTWPVPVTNGASTELTWQAADTVADNPMLQVRAVFAFASGTQATPTVRMVVDRFASMAAVTDIGPGSVNLTTGDFRIADTDVAELGMDLSRVATSRTPVAEQGGQAPIFGPQWQWSYVLGSTSYNVVWLRRQTPSTVEITTGSGTVLRFAKQVSGSWLAEAGRENLVLTYDGSVDRFALTDVTATDRLLFGRIAGVDSGYAVVSSGKAAPGTDSAYVHEPVQGADSVTRARLKRIVAPTSAATTAACSSDPSVRGCRVLEPVYATATTASSTSLGDHAGQVSSIRVWSTSPGATAGTPVTVARYAYDGAGRLREVWDPRVTPALKTAYQYDDAGRISTYTAAGELPWSLKYGVAGSLSTSGAGMLLAVERATLTPGSNDNVNGTARNTMVYDVPTVTAEGGPYDLSAGAVSAWGQKAVPTAATAIFPADAVPAANVGRGKLSSGAYARAEVYYLDSSGRQVDRATPGANIDVTDHDQYGHPVRTLTAENRNLALGAGTGAAEDLKRLGLTGLSTPQRAVALSSTLTYGADGIRKVEQTGPTSMVALTFAVGASGGMPALPAGTEMPARSHTVYKYDETRPTDDSAKAAHLVTTTRFGGAIAGYANDADVQSTVYEYDWRFGLQSKIVTDPAGEAIAETNTYDPLGQVIQTPKPSGTGSDAASTYTTYYTADGPAPCGGRPEWAGLQCRTGPSGGVTGGDAQVDELVTTTTTYTGFLLPKVRSEAANGVTRVTTIGYDDAGREVSRALTGGTGDAVPATTIEYDSATGRQTRTVDDAGAQVVNTHDRLGRLLAYRDSGGAVTTYEYDALDRVTKVTDPTGTKTHTYDTAQEARGLLTSVTDSVAGTFTARYDADGAETAASLPGGVTRTMSVNEVGVPVATEYHTAEGLLLLSEQVKVNVQGHWLKRQGLTTEAFTLDSVGRVIQTDSIDDGVCTRRAYEFDDGARGRRSNRTGLTTATGEPGAACSVSGGTEKTHRYDSADRIVDDGYTYDEYGRTTTLPGGLAVSYYADDRVRAESTATEQMTWTSDPMRRPTSFTLKVTDGISWNTVATKANHYRGDSDSPDWIVDDPGSGKITRNVRGVDGNLAATTSTGGATVLQLVNLHGDVNVSYEPATGVAQWHGTDEYGVPKDTRRDGRYGYLGGRQRSQEALGNTILMGARVYDPSIGRFLQTDPVEGGNANAYDYCSGDPNTCIDPTGEGGCFAWVFCGQVKNQSVRTLWAAQLVTKREGQRICNVHGKGGMWCRRAYVPYGGSKGGWGYDVDAFSFHETAYYWWDNRRAAKVYQKFYTGYSVLCTGGRYGYAPRCA